MCFTRFVLDFESKSMVGLSLIVVTSLNVAINLGIITGNNVAILSRKLKLTYLARR